MLREYRPSEGGDLASSQQISLPPTTTFYALRAGTEQVGFRSVTTDTLPDGIRVTSRVDVDVPLPLVPRRLLTTTEALYDQRFRLVAFTSTMSGEAGQQTQVGRVDDDGRLSVVISGRGQTRADTVLMTLPAGTLLPDAVSIGLAAGGNLKTGVATTVSVLDPVELTIGRWDIRVVAESTFVLPDSAAIDSLSGAWRPAGVDTIPTVRVEWMEYGLPVRAWIDQNGAVIARETPLGLSEHRGPYEIVNSGYVRRRPRNVQAPPLEIPTPEADASGPTRLTLGPVDLRGAASLLDTRWQAVERGMLVSRQVGTVSPARGPLPDSVAAAYREVPSSIRVRLDAARIAGADSAAPGRAARKLAAWVGSTIVAGLPSYGDPETVLLRRRGDSSDRASVFVAMARSLGIAARPVAGLLTTGERPRYRAWAEVWLDGWVPVDPTLGQFPADGGHFRLLINATARPSTLIPMLGAVRPALTTTAMAP
ncbi:MAG TPA: transglutaminase domain-containing protein [Gemmatimonadales bacterium]|nr:transglutaminase domain-containing protein [Gemmatimonadales bacterium]